MNKFAFAVLLLLCVSHASVTYTADIDRIGQVSITVSIEGGDGTSVPTPEDAHGYVIVGGSFSESNGTAYITPGSTGFTTFSFYTDMLTEKTSSGWTARLSPPDSASVMVYMPPHSSFEESSPNPVMVTADDSRNRLDFHPSESIVVYYRLDDLTAPGTEGSPFNIILLFGGAMILGAILRDMYSRLEKKPLKGSDRKPSFDVTAGKKEMMETFNENDKVVVDSLLESQGKAKRNALERKTGISKSSLAVSLNRLEKRKIIEMDRTSTTHFVKLSDYFLRL
jgi:uncharacterized membrane protein